MLKHHQHRKPSTRPLVIIAVLIAFCLWLLAVGGTLASAQGTVRPRFEHIYAEPSNRNADFTVYHDKETGQEIVCREGRQLLNGQSQVTSCWLTGRSWK